MGFVIKVYKKDSLAVPIRISYFNGYEEFERNVKLLSELYEEGFIIQAYGGHPYGI